MKEKICPYCGGTIELRDNKGQYGKSHKYSYVCSNAPECDAYVGCYKNTKKPYGTFSDQILRDKRKEAHLYFDAIWKEHDMTRSKAYILLAKSLSLPVEKCHIKFFSLKFCEKTIKFSKRMCTKLDKHKMVS